MEIEDDGVWPQLIYEFLNDTVFREQELELGIPVPIIVKPVDSSPRVAAHDPINIEHREDHNLRLFEQLLVLEDPPDDPLDEQRPLAVSGMLPGHHHNVLLPGQGVGPPDREHRDCVPADCEVVDLDLAGGGQLLQEGPEHRRGVGRAACEVYYVRVVLGGVRPAQPVVAAPPVLPLQACLRALHEVALPVPPHLAALEPLF
jgi:hypothetical protein